MEEGIRKACLIYSYNFKNATVSGDLGGGPQVTLTLHSDGSSETKQHTQYTIPAGTTLAYSCYELKIGDDGALSLHLGDH